VVFERAAEGDDMSCRCGEWFVGPAAVEVGVLDPVMEQGPHDVHLQMAVVPARKQFLRCADRWRWKSRQGICPYRKVNGMAVVGVGQGRLHQFRSLIEIRNAGCTDLEYDAGKGIDECGRSDAANDLRDLAPEVDVLVECGNEVCEPVFVVLVGFGPRRAQLRLACAFDCLLDGPGEGLFAELVPECRPQAQQRLEDGELFYRV